MTPQLQEGIYYLRKPQIGNSFTLLLLKVNQDSEASEVGRILQGLWSVYQGLKRGIVKNLSVHPKHRSSGNLSVLIGYGHKIFTLRGVKRTRPADFDDRWLFRSPNPNGGGAILEGSDIYYANEVTENRALSDQIVIQFIADNEFYTYRALVETWKELYHLQEKNWGKNTLHISSFYAGFQRADGRNWLGFHDGVSNMKTTERRYAICINPNYQSPQDKWLVNGTYLAFLRISTNLEAWENLPVEDQELIIGREKLTGCPLIGVDNKGKPVKDRRCPVPGTSEVIDRGNEYFREHPQYGRNVSPGISNKVLENSHINTMRPTDRNPAWDKKSIRIFRQGFEFVDSVRDYPTFRVGLNFVSFQNSPEKLYRSLTYRFRKAKLEYGLEKPVPNLDNFLSVYAAGIFLVPPFNRQEHFPGAGIFFSAGKLLSSTEYR